jgi:hypothetical protein
MHEQIGIETSVGPRTGQEDRETQLAHKKPPQEANHFYKT